jgi:3-oxoacyl-[acyl-carrier-protein] synthase-1
MNIYVTGMGMMSAIGNNVSEALDSLLNSRSGIAPITILNTRHQADFVLGEVKMTDQDLREKVQVSSDRHATRTTLLGLFAAQEALNQANYSSKDGIRTGLISATTVGGANTTEVYFEDFLAGKKTANFIDTEDDGDCTEYLADYFEIKHYVTTLNTACASSTQAIALAARMLKSGFVDRVLVGGADALCRLTFNGFNSLQLLSSEPCRPFDTNRQGLNLGEGAAFLVLENEKSLQKTNNKVLVKLSGYGVTNDAYHQTSSSPNGAGLYASMQNALSVANLKAQEIDYVNAHGTATGNNDLTEGWAIRNMFGKNFPFSSTKGFTGHTLAAAGAIEAVISILCLQNQIKVPNLNFEQSIEEHQMEPITKLERNVSVKHVLSNSAGMGGACASVIFSLN